MTVEKIRSQLPKVYTSKSDGIYIGLSGQTKRTWEIMYGQPMGLLLRGFGLFLSEEYHSSFSDEKAVELAKRLKEEFSKHGHSGGSALVEIQQLFDLLGARCLDKNTRAYLLDLKEYECKKVERQGAKTND